MTISVRGVVARGKGEPVEVTTVLVPEPGPGEALVTVQMTGVTGAGETVSNPVLDHIAQAAILAIDEEPEGLFGVDLTYDRDCVPNPTEINVGRFFTTHQFFTELGVNMPYLFVKVAFGEKLPPIADKLNPAPNSMIWIRGIDFEPVLTSTAEIEKNVVDLENLRHGFDGSGSRSRARGRGSGFAKARPLIHDAG